MTLLQKLENCNKLYKLPFFSPQPHPHNNHVNHCVFSPIAEELFILCMLWFNRHVILPHVVIWFCNLAFICFPTCFWRQSNLGTIVSTFNLQANTTLDHVHFPICSKHIFRPCKLCYPNILKILVNFPFPNPFKTIYGVNVKHIITFCCNILCTNINFKCSAFGCTTNNNITTFTWGTNFDDTRDVNRK